MPASNVTDIESRKSTSTSEPKKPALVTNHPTFFFNDRLIVIQVESVRFNVHKYQLSKSKTFADLLVEMEKAEAEGKPAEGSSIDNPIELTGVSAADFERLLTVLYASQFSTNQLEPEASLIIPAFRLANLLDFSDLRAYLLPLAEKVLGDVDKIVFARVFDIKDWLAPAHVNLCQRSIPLTTKEARRLGIHSLLMISLLREEFPPPKPIPTSTPGCPGPSCNCGQYHTSTIHCAGCIKQPNPPIPEAITQKIKQRLDEWVDNDCAFAG